MIGIDDRSEPSNLDVCSTYVDYGPHGSTMYAGAGTRVIKLKLACVV